MGFSQAPWAPSLGAAGGFTGAGASIRLGALFARAGAGTPAPLPDTLSAYCEGRFPEAGPLFGSIAAEDPPAGRYAERCRELAASPPETWDGVWVMTSK